MAQLLVILGLIIAIFIVSYVLTKFDQRNIKSEKVVDNTVMIQIQSLYKVYPASRTWLIKNGKKINEAEIILSNIDIPFDATGMDLKTAPFKYVVVIR